jgi:hypothetical protein
LVDDPIPFAAWMAETLEPYLRLREYSVSPLLTLCVAKLGFGLATGFGAGLAGVFFGAGFALVSFGAGLGVTFGLDVDALDLLLLELLGTDHPSESDVLVNVGFGLSFVKSITSADPPLAARNSGL